MRLLLLTVFLLPVAAFGQTVRLPLDGYYRPGEFFPVLIEADRPVSVEVQLDAGVGSRGQGRSLILPALTTARSPGTVRVLIDGQPRELPIRPLPADQKLLLAVAPGDVAGFLRVESPGLKPGDWSMAFESVDDVAIPPEWDDDVRTVVRAMGVQIVGEPAGTRGLPTLNQPGIYDVPVIAGRSVDVRRTTLLLAAALAIVLLGVALIPRRRAWRDIVLLAVLGTGVGVVVGGVSPISRRMVRVAFTQQDATYEDAWFIRAAIAETADRYPVHPRRVARPVFAGAPTAYGLSIEVTPAAWIYHYQLPRQGRIAFVSRELIDKPGPVNAQSPGDFEDFVRRAYRPIGQAVGGITANGAERYVVWP